YIPIPYPGCALDRWFALEDLVSGHAADAEDAENAHANAPPNLSAPTGAPSTSAFGGGSDAHNRSAERRARQLGATMRQSAVGGTSCAPQVRLRVRWVPLYAPRKAFRASTLKLDFAGVGMSIVNNKREELLYFTMSGLDASVHYYHTGHQHVQGRLEKLQLDCQLPHVQHPVVLGAPAVSASKAVAGGPTPHAGGAGTDAAVGADDGSPSYARRAEQPHRAPNAAAGAVQPYTLGWNLVTVAHPTVTYIEDVSLLLTRLSIQVDDELLQALLQFISTLQLVDVGDPEDPRVLLEHTRGALHSLVITRCARIAARAPSIGSGGTAPARPPASSAGAGEEAAAPHADRRTVPVTGWGGASSSRTVSVVRSGGAAPPRLADVVAHSGRGLLPSPVPTDAASDGGGRRVRRVGAEPGYMCTDMALSLLKRNPLLQGTSVLAAAPSTVESRIFLAMVRMHPLAVDITFALSDDTRFLSDMLPDIAVFGYLKNIIAALGSTLANIDHAPLALPSLYAEYVFETPTVFTSRLTGHYIQGAIREWYKILGSAEFLGNPVGLVRGMGRDVMRLLYEPAAGLLDTPSAFGITVAQNALALVRNTAVGVLGSTAKVLSSLSKGVKALAVVDAVHAGSQLAGRPHRRVGAPANVGQGVVRGVTAAARGLFYGITGVASQPYRGFRRGFVPGLRGVAGGVVGLFVQPVAGVIEGLALGIQGAANTIAPHQLVLVRDRLPRFINSYGLLLPFSTREAEGATLVSILQSADALRPADYVYHTTLRALEV
ncbi:hypothetical protein EON62_01780, partial [archaeon]